MITKTTSRQHEVSIVILEDLVPQDHLLRKVDKSFDFSFIYPLVEDLYSHTGRPSIDPVVLVKYAFLNHLYGFNSIRRTFEEAKVNLAFRWFLGYGIEDKLPHFSDFSKTYLSKFSKEVERLDEQGQPKGSTTLFQEIFTQILLVAHKNNYLSVAHIYMDSTHIKANANKKKSIKVNVLEESKQYQSQLDRELDDYCSTKGIKKAKPIEYSEKQITQSTIDPDCGVFNKGDHEVKMAYSAQTICDQNGFILDTKIYPANKHDSITFYEPFRNVLNHYQVGRNGICSIGLDAGYKTPGICREILEVGITPLLPYTRPKGKKFNEENPLEVTKKDFIYDQNKGIYYCPQGKIMEPRTVDRKSGYVIYKTKVKQCKECPMRTKCLSKTASAKEVRRHLWQDKLDEAELIRKTNYHKVYYAKRSQTIERIFADAKEKHGMRFTRMQGIKKVQDQVLLIFSVMNLKKIAKWNTSNLVRIRLEIIERAENKEKRENMIPKWNHILPFIDSLRCHSVTPFLNSNFNRTTRGCGF